jgi:hypothetical protein
MINYSHIARAIEYYTALGYEQIEVPWVVPMEVAEITHKNALGSRWTLGANHSKILVGSGEQSFLDMILRGELAPGRYVCATPCFRDEYVIDELHRPYFFKVELINTLEDITRESALWMASEARNFFKTRALRTSLYMTEIEDCWDIYASDIEIGSYGYREHTLRAGKVIKWVYGTGCAEPRMSIALNRQKNG